MSLPARLLGANPSVQVSSLLTGNFSTPSAKQTFITDTGSMFAIATANAVGATTVTFDVTGLGATYKHLQVRASFVMTSSSLDYFNLNYWVNGDNASGNWSKHSVRAFSNGSQATVGQANQNNGGANDCLAVSGYSFSSVAIIDIYDAFSTDKYKTFMNTTGSDLNGGYPSAMGFSSSNWRSTDAITSITFLADAASTWSQDNRIALYGIKG